MVRWKQMRNREKVITWSARSIHVHIQNLPELFAHSGLKRNSLSGKEGFGMLCFWPRNDRVSPTRDGVVTPSQRDLKTSSALSVLEVNTNEDFRASNLFGRQLFPNPQEIHGTEEKCEWKQKECKYALLLSQLTLWSTRTPYVGQDSTYISKFHLAYFLKAIIISFMSFRGLH